MKIASYAAYGGPELDRGAQTTVVQKFPKVGAASARTFFIPNRMANRHLNS